MKARYGFRGDDAQQKRERKTIRKIADDTALGITAGVIASWLNTPPMPTPGPEGGTWSRKAVERVIEGNPKAMARGRARLKKERERTKAIAQPKTVEEQIVELHNEGHEPEDRKTYREIEEDRKRRERIQQAATVERLSLDKDHVFFDPGVFPGPAWPTYETMDAAQRIGHATLAGKDTWSRAVESIVAELVTARGEPIHELLDRIKGQPEVKGPLRRMVYGLMREIALQRQANLALRQKLGQHVQPEKPRPTMEEAEAQIERWKAEQRSLAVEETFDRMIRGPEHEG